MTFDIAIEARNANGIMQIASLAEATEISLANEAPAQALTIRWSGHHVQRGIWETVAQIAGQIDPLGFSVGVVANILSSFLWHKIWTAPFDAGPRGSRPQGTTGCATAHHHHARARWPSDANHNDGSRPGPARAPAP
jgi:hypothetical protein